jgi:hypothetical protein
MTNKGQGENVSRIRRNRGRALAIAASAVAVLAVVVGSASGITIKGPEVQATFEGSFSPTAFPKKEKSGLTLKLEGKIKKNDGTHPPAVKTVSLDFDKAGELFTKGLPTCKKGELESTLTTQAKASCGDALVGTGRVSASIQFPEQAPFGASGPLLIFNASKGNKQALLLHVYAKVPAPTTFVVPVSIKKTGGKYGTNAFIKVPAITSGQGSVTSFKAKIGKKWSVGGKKESLLNASCPTGSLAVQGEFTFTGAPALKGVFTKPCQPKG